MKNAVVDKYGHSYSEEAIQKRLARAKDELNAEAEFDATVVNDDLEHALEQLIGLIFSS